jgi:hypothetical protein
LGNTKVLRLQYFVLAKHHKVFKTTVFLKTVVFYEYFKNTLLPNGAYAATIVLLAAAVLNVCDAGINSGPKFVRNP